MSQPEMCSERSEPVPTVLIPFVALFNLHNPFIIRVACKAMHPVSRHLILKINIRHRWSNIMRVEVEFCDEMAQFEPSTCGDVLQWFVLIIKTIVSSVNN